VRRASQWDSVRRSLTIRFEGAIWSAPSRASTYNSPGLCQDPHNKIPSGGALWIRVTLCRLAMALLCVEPLFNCVRLRGTLQQDALVWGSWGPLAFA